MASRSRWRKCSWLVAAGLLAAVGAVWWLRAGRPDAVSSVPAQRRPALDPNWSAQGGAGATIAGQVSDDAQQPIAQAQVCANVASSIPHRFRAVRCTRTDANGRYRLEELEPQTYSVAASADGFVASANRYADAPLSVRAGEAHDGIDLSLSRGELNLRGSVIDATGGPVPNANVRAERTLPPRMVVDTWSDDLGQFALALPEGPVELQAA
ncbi:MAG TPA: carboxypeptidase-like regulatory domain-containing protein, partial [Polyangiaceae bacterium]|nr:carboxypeptidase-like regulatory domain-containing protein [Polyangiaceae bacterium]